MRLRHRDRVTAQLKRTTHRIRKRYESLFAGLEQLNLPLPLDPEKTHPQPGHEDDEAILVKQLMKMLRGGYTVSMAVMNGCLLTLILIAAFGTDSYAPSVTWGILLAIVLGLIGSVHFPNTTPPKSTGQAQ